MKISVIILNYNVRYFLEQSIISVQRALNGIDSEIIIVDNNSDDTSCEMVRVKFPNLLLIENDTNLGFSKANNIAVKRAKGEYICILNPDTAVSEDTFRKCLSYANSVQNLGALGVNLMDGTGEFLPESKRNLPTPKTSLLKLFGMTNSKNGYYAKHLDQNGIGQVSILVGAFMLMKRDVYEEVGGFDEDYFMYGEDIDLSYKLEKAGYVNYYLGSASILHYKGESTQRNSDYYERFYGAMRIFYKKHFRGNFMLNALVNIGVSVASVFKRNNGQKNKRSEPQATLVLTEDFTMLKSISEVVKTPVQSVSKSVFEGDRFMNTQFIFDVNYMNYSQIFSVMKKQKGYNNSFRIIPPSCNYMLGSDTSDENGSVFVF